MAIKKFRKKPGTIPGAIVFTGKQKVEKAMISIVVYDEHGLEEHQYDGQTFEERDPEKTTWVDMRGVHNTEIIEELGRNLKIHPLVLEDITDIHQRPKYEEYDDGFFIILRAFSFQQDGITLDHEQVAIYVKKGLVLSFQEDAKDVFTGVRDRLIPGKGRIRMRKADYLGYALMDNVVDYYYHLMDRVEELLDDLEDEIVFDPSNSTKSKIHKLRRELLTFRKGITPLREAVSRFMKSEHELIEESTWLFIRDLYDHTVQSMDLVETYRDTLSGLQDLYLSEISFKMNGVMQVLTIISTIFIPLTFLAGIYGMNFEYIPELKFRNGYFILLGVMFAMAVALLYLFRRKKWI